MARIQTDADIASEFRYRAPPMSQGRYRPLGEPVRRDRRYAGSAALHARTEQHVLSIVNVPESSMARVSDAVLETVAGPEMSVASTKAFTAQLSVLACLAIAAGRARETLSRDREQELMASLLAVPGQAEDVLDKSDTIRTWRTASSMRATSCSLAVAAASRSHWKVRSS